MTITPDTLQTFLQTNWLWATGLAAAMVGLTLFAAKLLNPARKDEIALWLMGAVPEEDWSRNFVALFDAAFGANHFSFRCFLRSSVASVIAVVAIWALMGEAGTLGLRLKADLSLGAVLWLALAVNIVADYVSLLETRFLLGRICRLRSTLAQAAVLVLDFALSAAIIWLAIFAYLRSPLHAGEIESFAEILGLFSIFSVLFYSTFLTSVWTWAYILTTWLLRLFTRLRLPHFLDVEHKPVQIIAYFLGFVVFLGALGSAAILRKDAQNLTAADRALCDLFKGRVCLDVAGLTSDEQVKLDLVTRACEGGVTQECVVRADTAFEIRPEEAARLWKAACDGRNALACTNLGFMYETSLGVRFDLIEAARLHRKSCDGGSSFGCTNLGRFYENGLGVSADSAAAARLYRHSCDSGSATGCTNLGVLNEWGKGLDRDPVEAARLYRQGCDGGNLRGCVNLGFLHRMGLGMDPDPIVAAQLFRTGCDGGDALGCTSLGIQNQFGNGMERDPFAARRLYQTACDVDEPTGCHYLAIIHEEGVGVPANPAAAVPLFAKACRLGVEDACERMGAAAR